MFILGGGTLTAWVLYQWLSPRLATSFLGKLQDQFPNLWVWFWYWGLLSVTLVLFANLANTLASTFPVLSRPKPIGRTAGKATAPRRTYHIACDGCGVTLRFPKVGKVKITCPRCGHQSVQS